MNLSKPPADSFSTQGPGWGRQRIILFLLFLPFALGLIFFGGVRIWAIGPLALLVFIALFLFFSAGSGGMQWRSPPGWIGMGLFLLFAFIQGETAPELVWAARVKTVMIASAVAALLMWTSLAGRGNRWKILLGVALVLIAAAGAYAWIQDIRGSRMVLYLVRPEMYEMRASSTYFCPNHFANMAAMAMCLALALAMNPESGRALRWLSGFIFAFLAYPLLLTQSRSGVLSALAGTGTLLLLVAFRRGARRLLLVMLVLPLLLGAAGWAAWRYGPQMQERVEKAVRGYRDGTDWRIVAWQGTWDMFRDRPVFGHGGGSYRHVEPQYARYHWGLTATYAHQEFLQALAEYGIVGFVLLLAFVGTAMIRLLMRVKKSARPRNALLAAGCLSVIVCSLVHALFDFNFHIYANSHFLFLVAGVTFACLYEDGEWKIRRIPPGAARALRWGGSLAAVALFLIMVRSGLSYGICFPAESALRGKDHDRADRGFRAAARLDSSYWRPWFGLGRSLLDRAIPAPRAQQSGLLQESREAFKTGLVRNPHSLDGWAGLSQVENLLGDEEAALAALREMVRIHRDFPYYHSRIGVQLYRMGRMEEARESFEVMLRHHRSDRTALMHMREIERRLAQDAENRARESAP